MSDPHNPARYGEVWEPSRLKIMLEELEAFKGLGAVSGGFAWHIMSPPHEELKHRHDHKDIDIIVEPTERAEIIQRLEAREFYREPTRLDTPKFRRYVNVIHNNKIVIDLFVEKDVPHIDVDDFRVVEPSYLVGLYRTIHSSGGCFAVHAAKHLLARGEEVVKNPLLATFVLGDE